MAINIVLFEPEIPQNTGNIIRTCACTGAVLHLIRPLGFVIDEKQVKRAGMDYIQYVDIRYYDTFEDFEKQNPGEYFLFSTKSNKIYTDVEYKDDCFLIFGKESAGLRDDIREKYKDGLVRVPMSKDEHMRSLNLANTVAISVFEAIRQIKPEDLI